MKTFTLCQLRSRMLTTLLAICMAQVLGAQTFNYQWLDAGLQADTTKKSVRTSTRVAWDGDTVRIGYHSPAVRKRSIWGGVVPWDEVWVSGAHMATHIELPRNVTIGGQKLRRGKYALFTIPHATGPWELVINRNWEQHLTDEYDTKADVLRLQVEPLTLQPGVERLQWLLTWESNQQATLHLVWHDKWLRVAISR